MKLDLLPQIGLKLTLPLERDDVIKSYLGADGKSIKIVIKRANSQNTCSSERFIPLPRCNGKKIVVLDPGQRWF